MGYHHSLSESLKLKRLTIPSAGENKEQMKLSYTVRESVNHHLEKGLTLSTKAKYMFFSLL